MRAYSAILTIILTAGSAFAGSTLQIVPTTTVATETSNNTSAADSFTAQSNGNPAPGNTSKLPIRGLMYAGSTTRIYAHFMPWFGGSNHMWVGYHSDDPAQVNKQVNDMMSRGYDGAIVDWYGPEHTRENNTTLYLRDNAETRGGAFVFAVMEDVGALNACANTAGCDVTQKMINDLNYAASTYYSSPAYMYIGGRPVMFFFGVDKYTIDWTRARAGANGNPLFIFRNSGAFTHAQSNGGYSWVGISSSSTDMGLSYLDGFYSTAVNYPTKQTFGSGYPGFNNSLAAWVSNPPKIVDRQCGQTWMATLAEAGKYYSATHQLTSIQTVTWNDYEEASQLETGIDGCLALSASINGSQLSWTVSGAASAVDHYNIFISTDGVNLMKLTPLNSAQGSLDLSTFALAPGAYTLYVQAYAKPALHNAFSNAVRFTLGDAPPAVSLALDVTSGVSPQTVNAALTASDSDGTVASTTLNFGDGSAPVSGSFAAHSYTAAGTYTVTATATDNAGMSASATQLVTIAANQPPVASLSLSPGSGIAPLSVTASTATSTDPDGSVASSTIDFGDGTVTPGPTASHTYSTTGTKTVTATVTDNKGASSSTTATVTVNANQPPVAALSVTPTSGIAPVTVSASTAASYDSDGTVASSKIDFGDGTVLAGPSASHTYTTTGVKTITATVTDDRGASSTASGTVQVSAASPSLVTITSPADGSTLLAPMRVAGSGTSSTEVWLTQVYLDGAKQAEVQAASIDITLSPAAGAHRVTIQCYDRANNVFKSSVSVTVNAPPVAALSVTPASGTAPVTVTASTAASSDPDGTIASSSIDFGDGTVLPGPSASHTYSTAGTKTVTATVTDNAGASATAFATVTVAAANQPPVAVLSVTPASGIGPLAVFASTSGSYDPDGSIASSRISWGDGSSTIATSGNHFYSKVGTYTVTTTVTDNSGASTSISKTVLVTAGVKVSSPLNGATYSTTLIKVTATAISTYPIISMRVYVDSVIRYTVYSGSVSAYLSMSIGTHSVMVQAWDSSGKAYKSAVTITAR